MKRSGPIKRRSPLRAKRPAPEALQVRRECLRIARYACQAGTPACTLMAHHAHHVRMRSQGGQDTLDNLLAVCPPCHEWIHAHPEVSYSSGWLARGGGR